MEAETGRSSRSSRPTRGPTPPCGSELASTAGCSTRAPSTSIASSHSAPPPAAPVPPLSRRRRQQATPCGRRGGGGGAPGRAARPRPQRSHHARQRSAVANRLGGTHGACSAASHAAESADELALLARQGSSPRSQSEQCERNGGAASPTAPPPALPRAACALRERRDAAPSGAGRSSASASRWAATDVRAATPPAWEPSQTSRQHRPPQLTHAAEPSAMAGRGSASRSEAAPPPARRAHIVAARVSARTRAAQLVRSDGPPAPSECASASVLGRPMHHERRCCAASLPISLAAASGTASMRRAASEMQPAAASSCATRQPQFPPLPSPPLPLPAVLLFHSASSRSMPACAS